VDRQVEFLEVAATKEYAGGYPPLKVFTGGYQVNFHKTRGDLARQWSQRTRGEYFGIYPHYTLGTIGDRNHTVVRDLSGPSSVH
jgi:3',5'-cyclic-AMP phosphodiesterase